MKMYRFSEEEFMDAWENAYGYIDYMSCINGEKVKDALIYLVKFLKKHEINNGE